MNKNILVGIFSVLLLLPVAAQADQHEWQPSYAYATYFICSPDRESRVDEIVESSFKPHYDAAVEHGDILSWSWMQHYVGGTWRRVLVLIASDMDMLLDASGALGEIVSDQTPEAGRAFSEICYSHEDYIWETIEGVGSGEITDQRGFAGFSLYLQCDMNREERVDELVREVIGPVYDRHMGEDGLTTWNYLKHNVGGKWRRIVTMGAPDHKTLMRTRAKIIEELGAGRTERAMREVNTICHTHQDYLWDTVIQTP